MNIDRHIDLPQSRTVHDSLVAFSQGMTQRTQPSDGVLTARVIGEFSAGKTRLLRELFSTMLPPELFPVSSLERQTRLQLEITFGAAPSLTLIERPQDYSPAIELQALSRFPERDELGALDPLQHRLRLTLPDQRLILPDGDGFSDDHQPKRLFLIDTPGWNSGDDELAESDAASIMTGYHNLSLVYVTHAGRLDGALNAGRLNEFLTAFEDAEFIGRHALLMVVTHCPTADAERFKVKAQRMVHGLWEGLGRSVDDLDLHIFCVEFTEMTDAQRQTFRDGFWKSLMNPLKQQGPAPNPWVSEIRRWSDDWDIRVSIAQTQQLVESARQLLQSARKGDDFIHGMNRHRLLGLDQQAIGKKLRDVWQRQLGSHPADLEALQGKLIPIDNQHPLAHWWRDYWLVNIQKILAPMQHFMAQMDHTIGKITPETEDLQSVFRSALTGIHQEAVTALDNSFTQLLDLALSKLIDLTSESRIATLLSLSILEARYSDHYAAARLLHASNARDNW